jgi:hypothetical protein
VRERYEHKSAHDREEIHAKIREISSSRSYRILGALESIIESIEVDALPAIKQSMERWRRRVLQFDAAMVGALLVLLAVIGYQSTGGFGPWFNGQAWSTMFAHPVWTTLGAVVLAGVLVGIHFFNRRWLARRIARDLPRESSSGNWQSAFLKNTRPWRSLFIPRPKGLGRFTLSRLRKLRDQAEAYIQKLNNQFVDASPAAPGSGRASAADVQPSADESSRTRGDDEPAREAPADAAGTTRD